jgi:hypothetical protein
MKIGERDAPRIVHPCSTWDGSSYPHANVGDTLVIPVHVDRPRRGHAFALVDKNERNVAAFFTVAGMWSHDRYIKRGADSPVVRNDAAERLDLLASWEHSVSSVSGRRTSHSFGAYLEFKKPGEYNLAGRLADAEETTTDNGTPIRVLPKSQPVTVLLQHILYTDYPGKAKVMESGELPAGTIEARVGDRVELACRGYPTTAVQPHEAHRQGVVTIKPLRTVPPYSPEAAKERSPMPKNGP